ncbi:35879_t:CDS:2, partial [Racocetra persica]
VIVQHSNNNKEKLVTIEYTFDSWSTSDSVTALRSPTLSNNQELYYFELSPFKIPNQLLHVGFLARFDIEDSTFWADSNYEYFYDEGSPKEFFFHVTSNVSNTQNISTEKNGLRLNEERKRLDEERKLLEEERKRHEEECKRREQEEEQRKLEEERRLLEEERRLLNEERMLFEKERRQVSKQITGKREYQCGHDIYICRKCVSEHIERELKGNIKILCPENNCRKVLNEKD